MKKVVTILCLALVVGIFGVSSIAHAAISAAVAYDVRTTGSDTNGGGFVTGASGTDWSQQDAAQYSVTDGVTAGTTTITSATANFGTDVVGNIIYVTGGTGSVATSWYQIISRTNSTTIVVDRSTGLTAGTGVTLKIGGSFATIQQGINTAFITSGPAIADARVYIKKGNYTGTVALVTAGSVAAVSYRNRIIGYNSTHDDNPMPQSGNQPVYAVGSGAGVNGIDLSTSGFTIENITLDGTQTSGTKGVKGINVTNSVYHRIYGAKIMNFSAEAYIQSSGGNGNAALAFSEITGCAGTTAAVTMAAGAITYNWIHNNTKSGISTGASSAVVGNLITNNTGSTSDGITLSTFGTMIAGNTIYGNGRDGIRTAGNVYDTGLVGPVVNNIIAKNGATAAGFGLNVTGSTPTPLQSPLFDYNAVYSNNSGNYSTHIAAGAHDVAVTSNPFISSDAVLAAETSPNWGLNNNSAGRALQRTGFPGQMPGLTTTTGSQDIGLFQTNSCPAFTGGRVLINGSRVLF